MTHTHAHILPIGLPRSAVGEKRHDKSREDARERERERESEKNRAALEEDEKSVFLFFLPSHFFGVDARACVCVCWCVSFV